MRKIFSKNISFLLGLLLSELSLILEQKRISRSEELKKGSITGLNIVMIRSNDLSGACSKETHSEHISAVLSKTIKLILESLSALEVGLSCGSDDIISAMIMGT